MTADEIQHLVIKFFLFNQDFQNGHFIPPFCFLSLTDNYKLYKPAAFVKRFW
nr:MAG TPA: hypothetical protein [Caudoviricetes sp.]